MSTAGFLFLICKMKMQANGMAHVKDMSDRWKKRTLICVTVVDQWPIAVGSICMMIGCGEECKWWECLWAQECAQRQKVKEIQISCRQKYLFFFKFNFIFFLCFACGRLCVVIAVINFAVCRAIFWGEFFSLRVLDDLCWGIVCVWFSFYLVSVQSTIPCVCVCV